MKKKFKFPWRAIISVLTILLVVVVIIQNWPDITETFAHVSEANLFVLFLLIPEQLFMYFSCGQIFFSYLKRKFHKTFTKKEILTISTELNFVNHAVPAGGLGGLAYLTYRLRQFDISAGQSSFLYLFRYAVTTVVNYFQALLAVIILAVLHLIPAEATWLIWVALLMNLGVFAGLGVIIFIAMNKTRITKFSNFIANFLDRIAKIFTFGHAKHMLKPEKIHHYFTDIHECVIIVKKDKKSLRIPTLWGVIYSLCEIAVYWIVAISLGQPGLLPFIMVGEAIGSIFDAIVPYGLPELGMIGVMATLGVDAGVATIVTVMARVFSLFFTIITGYLPYQRVIQGKAKEEKNA